MSWYVEKRIILQRFYGEVTVSEIIATQDEFRAMVRSGTRFVHLLVDLQDVTKHPMTIKDVSSAVDREPNEDLGWILVVTPNALLRFLGSFMGQLARQRINTFRTWEEALQFLALRDDTIKLNELPPVPLPNRD